MELFHSKIDYFGYENITNPAHLYCGNALLNGSLFYQSQYCSNNFNNILNTLVVLFELMVVNQWHDILFPFSFSCISCVLIICVIYVLSISCVILYPDLTHKRCGRLQTIR